MFWKQSFACSFQRFLRSPGRPRFCFGFGSENGHIPPQSERCWPDGSLFASSIICRAASFHWGEWPCISNCCSFWGWKPHYSGLWSCDLAHSRSEVCAPQRGRLSLQGHSRAFLFLQGKGLARLRAHVFQGIPISGHTMLWVYLKECCQHKPKGNF